MTDIMAVITDPETKQPMYITLEYIREKYDYTATECIAIEIIKKEYSSPEYNLHILKH